MRKPLQVADTVASTEAAAGAGVRGPKNSNGRQRQCEFWSGHRQNRRRGGGELKTAI